MLGLKLIHVSKRGSRCYHFYTVVNTKWEPIFHFPDLSSPCTNWIFLWHFHTLCNFEDVPLQIQLPGSKSALPAEAL